MRRVIWQGGDRFEIQEAAGPEDLSLGAREVLLRVKAVGICATDLHILEGRFPNVKPPLVLGHEIAGVVERIGDRVTRVKPATRVTCDSVVGCGECVFCRRGSRQFCIKGYELGFNRDGGCQDWLVLPEENVYPISHELSMEEAAILDMEVFAALNKAGIRTDETVLILGPGPAGLVASQLAKIMGARKVLLSGETEERLAVGARLGVDRVINIRNEDLASAIREETSGFGVDLAMDCAGTITSFNQAVESVTPGGRVVLYGVYPDPLNGIHLLPVVLKDLIIYGSLSDRKHWNEVIRLVEQHQLNLKRLITHKFPLERAPEAYQFVRNRSDGVVKAVVQL